MPIAHSRLEVQQVLALLNIVRQRDIPAIERLLAGGLPFLVNFNEPDKGDFALGVAAAVNDEDCLKVSFVYKYSY